jgi:outer membrane protein assembly factor BamB
MQGIRRSLGGLVALGLIAVLSGSSEGSDWPRFRGPNGSGVSADTQPTPTTWSPTENLKWKAELPGPGSSSPIIVGEKVFVTCWSGYGIDRNDRGKQENLKRHLVCLERSTGKVLWDTPVAAYLPEDNYGGMFAENGYATHTPVSDGERVYVFFGKSGALAFDMEGKQLWQTPVGTGSDRQGWGSASSPILYKNLLIVTAAPESQTLCALDKTTGKEVWHSKADGFESTWGTPILVEAEGRTDLVVGVPYDIWGFNPDTGKLRWYTEAINTRTICSSVVTDGKLIYAMGDQGSGALAVRPGGTDDVSKTHIAWTGRDSTRIGTPVVVDGRMYYCSSRVAGCVDAKSGERIYQGRLGGGPAPAANEGEGRRRPGGGGGRGGRGGQDYSSPVAADGKLYFVCRNGETHVVKLGDKFEQLATNRVTDDTEDFSASPAISDGALYIRSSRHLYCVATKDAAK